MGKHTKLKPSHKTAANDTSSSKDSKKPFLKLKKSTKSSKEVFDSLSSQLAALGLRVKVITADGNCLFRSLSDQKEGNEGSHAHLRKSVIEHMAAHRDEFEPFLDSDEPFDSYLNRMKRDGIWAGHLELQAASLILQSNIAVYQDNQPRWTIKNFPDSAPLLHISYHDGEHYNSVRLLDDWDDAPPRRIAIADGTKAVVPKVLAVAFMLLLLRMLGVV